MNRYIAEHGINFCQLERICFLFEEKILNELKMVKYHTHEDIYSFKWDKVVSAFWRRYPNPFSTHVLTEDVVDRKVCGNQLITKRLICKTSSFPKWAESFVGKFHEIYLIEESILDLRSKTLVTYTRNVSLQHVMTTEEKCVYSVPTGSQETAHSALARNQENTLCHRQAWFDSKITGFGGMIASYGHQRYIKNLVKTSKGYNYVLNSLFGSRTQDIKSNKSKSTETTSTPKTRQQGIYGKKTFQTPVLHAVQS